MYGKTEQEELAQVPSPPRSETTLETCSAASVAAARPGDRPALGEFRGRFGEIRYDSGEENTN